MLETQQVVLFCNFKNLARYPFDDEECDITIRMDETFTKSIRLIPEIVDDGPSMFSQYYIKNWTIKSEEKDSKFMITIKLHLHRNVLMILLVVYVPTLMVTVINQAMNYMGINAGSEGRGGGFEHTIEVNISCMVVLAMIYSSVSTSLVPTPNVKIIEMWLLSSLTYAFTCILLNIRLSLVENRVSHQTRRNSNDQSTAMADIANSGSSATDEQISNHSGGVFSNPFNEASCLKFITVYVLPLMYAIFIIVYFTVINNFYNIQK